MIVQWDALGDSTGWAKKVPHTPEGQYLLAIVVPRGELPLHPEVAQKAGLDPGTQQTLEGYLRSCEKADHNDWIDPVGITVVKRMRERVAEKLNRILPQDTPVVATTRPFLGARTIADKLLPEGFGTDGRRGSAEEGDSGSGGGTGSIRSRLPRLLVRQQVYGPEGFTLHWRLIWNGRPSPADLYLLVDTEGSPISKGDWKNERLGVFPLSVRGATFEPAGLPQGIGGDGITQETLPELPGIRIVPDKSALAASAQLTVDGTLEVGVTNPGGAPVRSILVVDHSPGVKS
jgi:hypothetical protein